MRKLSVAVVSLALLAVSTQAVHAMPPESPVAISGGGRAGPATATQILGGGIDPQFTDAAPEKALLVGFEVGLGKWAGNDVVSAIRPIFLSPQAAEVLGKLHGTDTSRLVRVKAKPGYAVGAITAKGTLGIDGFSVTFMRIDKDRLNPKEAYESDWIGGKGSNPQTRWAATARRLSASSARKTARTARASVCSRLRPQARRRPRLRRPPSRRGMTARPARNPRRPRLRRPPPRRRTARPTTRPCPRRSNRPASRPWRPTA